MELIKARFNFREKKANGKRALDNLKRDFQARKEALDIATAKPEVEEEEEKDGGRSLVFDEDF